MRMWRHFSSRKHSVAHLEPPDSRKSGNFFFFTPPKLDTTVLRATQKIVHNEETKEHEKKKIRNWKCEIERSQN